MIVTVKAMAKELERLRPEMLERMYRMGYKHVSDFGRDLERKDIVSSETVRRALGGSGGYPKVQIENLIKVLAALDYTPAEIGKIVQKMGSEFWPTLLHVESSPSDAAWLRLMTKIGRASDEALHQLLGAFRLIARAESIDIDEEMEIIERRIKRNGRDFQDCQV